MSLHHFKHTFPQNNRKVWHNWHLGENASVSTRITSSAVSLPERWTHTHWRFFRHRVRTCNSGRMFIYSISISHFLFAFSSAALTAHKVYLKSQEQQRVSAAQVVWLQEQTWTLSRLTALILTVSCRANTPWHQHLNNQISKPHKPGKKSFIQAPVFTHICLNYCR